MSMANTANSKPAELRITWTSLMVSAIQTILEGLFQASYLIEPLAEEAKKEIHGMIMKTDDVLEAKQRERDTVRITKELMTDAVKVLVNDLGYPESALMDIRNLLSSL